MGAVCLLLVDEMDFSTVEVSFPMELFLELMERMSQLIPKVGMFRFTRRGVVSSHAAEIESPNQPACTSS